jgi:hypothetical protein
LLSWWRILLDLLMLILKSVVKVVWWWLRKLLVLLLNEWLMLLISCCLRHTSHLWTCIKCGLKLLLYDKGVSTHLFSSAHIFSGGRQLWSLGNFVLLDVVLNVGHRYVLDIVLLMGA